MTSVHFQWDPLLCQVWFKYVIFWPRLCWYRSKVLKTKNSSCTLLTMTPQSSRHIFTIFWVGFHAAFLWSSGPIHEAHMNFFRLQVRVAEFFIRKVVTWKRIQSVTSESLGHGTPITSVHFVWVPLLLCQVWSKSVFVWPGNIGSKLLKKNTL